MLHLFSAAAENACISHLARAHGPLRPDCLTGLREGLEIRNGGAKSRFEMSRGFPTIQPNLDTNRPGFGGGVRRHRAEPQIK
jgi:hypothetical protein